MSACEQGGCGCCTGGNTDIAIQNRPSLPAVQYRIGTYGTFLRAMIASAATKEELSNWTARSPRDFGMQFLDMWACLADILTFYQERIANEAWLRTASQRENVMRLAAEIDYRPGPGAAAIVYLAFTVDKGKRLTIPIGLKSQSVPGQNEKPQKFEAVESVVMDAQWNSVRVFPAPAAVNPFAKSRSGGILLEADPRQKPLAPGNRVVVFDGSRAEFKEIAKITRTDMGPRLEWTVPMNSTFTQPEARLYGRRFQLFGSQAPAQSMSYTADATSPTGLKWQLQKTSFDMGVPASTFPLESIVENLKPGGELLVVHTDPVHGFTQKGTIVSVAAKGMSTGSLSATVTQIQVTLTGSVPAGLKTVDLRSVTLYELTDAPVNLSKSEYGAAIPANSNRVYVPVSVLPEYPAKRSIILDDGAGEPHLATVDTAEVSGSHLVVSFTPAVTRSFSANTAVMLGNVAKATHGETVRNEILGNGDPTVRLQQFTLKKSPVTFVPQPGAPNGVASTVEVRADGVKWNEATTLLGAAPEARVYLLSVADDGKATLQFGSGEFGSRLPGGRNNIVAQYRQGLGPEGNVRPATITTLLDRPVGLKTVVNPTRASGGASPEPIEMARANAPNTVRTFGRIVSLTDFEDAARELSTVAKAKSKLLRTGPDEEVSLAVAGEGGQILSSTVLRDVLADLNSRRDVNRRLTVRAHQQVPVTIRGRVQVDPAYLADDVQAGVTAALLSLFSFDKRNLAQPAFSSDVFRVMQNVPGVVAVDLDQFGPNDVVAADWFQILSLDPANIDLVMQFESL